MKQKTLLLMVIAVACGLAASYMTSRLLAERSAKDEEAQEKIPVLVAKQNLAMGTYIKAPEKLFVVKEFTKGDEPKNALSSFDDLKDKRLNKPVGIEHHVTKDDVMDSKQVGFDGQLPPGTRAIAIRVSLDSLAGGFVMPNSRVDIIATLSRVGEPQTQTILQNMLVLAVGEMPDRNPEQKTIVAPTVTLAVKPEEAQKLTLAQSLGELKLALRKFGDEAVETIKPTRSGDVTRLGAGGDDKGSADDPNGGGGSKVPKALPDLPPESKPPEPVAVVKAEPKTQTMTIYNGGQVTKVIHTIEDANNQASTRIEKSNPDAEPTAKKTKSQPEEDSGKKEPPPAKKEKISAGG